MVPARHHPVPLQKIRELRVVMHSQSLRRTLVGRFMRAMKDFEQVGTRGFYRPIAQVSFEQAVELVAQSMVTARDLGLADLLVNTTGLTGFTPPSVFARYGMSTRWAQNAGSTLRVALVARAELIDPQKIGVLMLQNRGGTGDVFTNETEALAWLDARLGPGQCSPSFLNRSRSGETDQ
jgi:hypothetical protein